MAVGRASFFLGPLERLAPAGSWAAVACQAAELGATAALHLAAAVLGVVWSVASGSLWAGEDAVDVPKAAFYAGTVRHRRARPAAHAFATPFRAALVDLCDPPRWFVASGEAAGRLTAEQTRAAAGLEGETGRVRLLVAPAAYGLELNPIAVYFVYGAAGELLRCVSEVTNTPWGGRVRFPFDPRGQDVPKCLHVSPLMDMEGTWRLTAEADDAHVRVTVDVVGHPRLGDFFRASLAADRCPAGDARSERCGLGVALRHACTPHRVAAQIYGHALLLLLKGVAFNGIPDPASYRPRVSARAAAHDAAPRTTGCALSGAFGWDEPARWPWKN